MDIFIDEYGLTKYLIELFNKIRREKDTSNNSIFNINADIWNINQVFVKQTLIASFLQKENGDVSLSPEKDADFTNNRQSPRQELIKKLEAYIPNVGFERKDFIENLDLWMKTADLNPFIENDFNKKSLFRQASSISLMKEKKECFPSLLNVGLENIMGNLKNIIFVENISLNTIRFTQEMKGWGTVSHAMKNEIDIVVVDRYFFKAHNNYFSIHESSEFLIALCSGDKTKSAYSGDTRSPIPMISVHSVGDFLYRRQS